MALDSFHSEARPTTYGTPSTHYVHLRCLSNVDYCARSVHSLNGCFPFILRFRKDDINGSHCLPSEGAGSCDIFYYLTNLTSRLPQSGVKTNSICCEHKAWFWWQIQLESPLDRYTVLKRTKGKLRKKSCHISKLPWVGTSNRFP